MSAIPEISPLGLTLAFLPAALVIAVLYAWRGNGNTAVYATLRMLVQLLLIGHVLAYIFESNNWATIVAVIVLMLLIASWIATRELKRRNGKAYAHTLTAVCVGSVPILALVTQWVVDVEPWFSPRYVVPLAGMIISGAMTAVTLASERFQAETEKNAGYTDARRTALQAALIPMINALFAVGLVSLPGMMTGQILSGVSPLVAAQYQIVVMTMLFGAEGIAAAMYLWLQR